MNINIYEKYKIRLTIKSDYLSEENVGIYDNIFNTEKTDDILVIEGGELLNMINKYLDNSYLSEITILSDRIHIEIFNYNNGETESIRILFLKDVKDNGKRIKERYNRRKR